MRPKLASRAKRSATWRAAAVFWPRTQMRCSSQSGGQEHGSNASVDSMSAMRRFCVRVWRRSCPRRSWPPQLEAVRADEDVVAASRVRELEAKVRELERLLGRKTMEAEILREALEQARPKKPALRLPSPPPGGSR